MLASHAMGDVAADAGTQGAAAFLRGRSAPDALPRGEYEAHGRRTGYSSRACQGWLGLGMSSTPFAGHAEGA